MTTRTQLPDMIYVDGHLLTLPISDDETVPQWMERIAFILQYLSSNGWSAETVSTAKKLSRLHLHRIIHGVNYYNVEGSSVQTR